MVNARAHPLRPFAPSRINETAEIVPVLRAMFETLLELPAPGQADLARSRCSTGKVIRS
ncbi:hypothetical protein MES5069_310083 [Mesorhizobium escarrei]|uniref:Uncharacterized protein n=1 Tax=Mesorhizobium escarrei TaxID=666018 RepID=A0ABN8JWX8_9HYPH|nr:hypothetical protein MES5069_310083 [Mesorhizobium escarrei]